ncbi:MAG: insulinase family protein [Myxococcota bacterium]
MRLSPLLLLPLLACAQSAPLPPPVTPLAPTEDAAFRRSPPPLPEGAGETVPALGVESARLANGLTLWVVAQPASSSVAFSFASPRGGRAVACATGELAGLSARAVAEAGILWREGRPVPPPSIFGRSVQARVAADFARFDLDVLTRAAGQGFEVLARTLRAPTYAEEALVAVRLAELNAEQARLGRSSILRYAAGKRAVGEDASRWLWSRTDAVRRPSRDDIRRCARRFVRPEGAALVAVGATSLVEVQAWAEELLGGWGVGTAPPEVSPLEASWSSDLRIQHVVQDLGSAQLVALQPAPRRPSVEEEVHFALLAEVLAGSLVSRLSMRLRRMEGATYGIRPAMIGSAKVGLLSFELSVEVEDATDVLRALRAGLERVMEEHVRSDELRRAKRRLAVRFADRDEAPRSLAAWLGHRFAVGRSSEDITRYAEALAGASEDDLLAVARATLRPDALHIAVAGPPELERRLRSLGPVDVFTLRRN